MFNPIKDQNKQISRKHEKKKKKQDQECLKKSKIKLRDIKKVFKNLKQQIKEPLKQGL